MEKVRKIYEDFLLPDLEEVTTKDFNYYLDFDYSSLPTRDMQAEFLWHLLDFAYLNDNPVGYKIIQESVDFLDVPNNKITAYESGLLINLSFQLLNHGPLSSMEKLHSTMKRRLQVNNLTDDLLDAFFQNKTFESDFTWGMDHVFTTYINFEGFELDKFYTPVDEFIEKEKEFFEIYEKNFINENLYAVDQFMNYSDTALKVLTLR